MDPDNRREVDFLKRADILRQLKQSEINSGFLRDLLMESTEGRVKMFLIYRCLEARKKNKELFSPGVTSILKQEEFSKKHYSICKRMG